MSEAFSAIMMVGALVLPEVMVGMIEALRLGLRRFEAASARVGPSCRVSRIIRVAGDPRLRP